MKSGSKWMHEAQILQIAAGSFKEWTLLTYLKIIQWKSSISGLVVFEEIINFCLCIEVGDSMHNIITAVTTQMF